MSLKSKGINAERELIHMFWQKEGWSAVRVAGSGSSRYPSPDILAGNKLRKLAIESKIISDDKKYFSDEDIAQLKAFCNIFGAEPWIAIKFKGHDWLFISLEDLEKTENGYAASISLASRRGLLFEELIK